ncbi:putative calcium-binding protein CML43 [Silene latifolia]|uniref:putative calcium-binding protein CML43 n=1 Tax=Silene latifolia TaxID=37657 RepID=UPI003D787DC7
MDAAAATAASNKILTKKTSILRKSFKLRSESLNSLRLRRVFDTFDKNGDNLITVDEIHQALSVLGLDADASEISTIVAAFIKPNCAGLAYDDFVALHESLSDAFFDCENDIIDEEDDELEGEVTESERGDEVEGELAEAFKVFDEDGDGFISAKELKVVLSKLGLPEAKHEMDHIQKMISSVDQNSDGQVDFFEFKHMMLNTVLVPSS